MKLESIIHLILTIFILLYHKNRFEAWDEFGNSVSDHNLAANNALKRTIFMLLYIQFSDSKAKKKNYLNIEVIRIGLDKCYNLDGSSNHNLIPENENLWLICKYIKIRKSYNMKRWVN